MNSTDQDQFLLNYQSSVHAEAKYIYEDIKSTANSNHYVVDMYLKDVISKLYQFIRKEE